MLEHMTISTIFRISLRYNHMQLPHSVPVSGGVIWMQMYKIWLTLMHCAQQLILASPPSGFVSGWQARATLNPLLMGCSMITTSLEPYMSNKRPSEKSHLKVHVQDRAHIAVPER